jgi:hypothetical protein
MLQAVAQPFRWRASVAPVSESGFYALPVSADVAASAGLGLYDVRITDSATGKQVPYIVRRAGAKALAPEFTEFPIIANNTDSQYTVIDVQNPTATGVSDIWVVLRNTAVERFAAVSGSDDGKNWYIIDDYVLFQRSYTLTAGSYSQSIHFPQATYRYYRLRINNQKTDRLNVVKVGRYSTETSAPQPEYVPNTATQFLQKDSSNGRSYISITNSAPCVVNRLELIVNGPRFFKRSVNVYVSSKVQDTERYLYQVASYELSQLSAVLNIPECKAGYLLLEITNNDDPPLVVTKVSTYAIAQQLVAWLDKGKAYHIYTGNDTLAPPVYDLSQFRDSIPALLPIAAINQLVRIEPATLPIATKTSSQWIWITIIVLAILMSVLSFRLMKEVKGK